MAPYLDLCSVLILLSLHVWNAHVPKFCYSARQKHLEVAFPFVFRGSLGLVPLLSLGVLSALYWQAYSWVCHSHILSFLTPQLLS